MEAINKKNQSFRKKKKNLKQANKTTPRRPRSSIIKSSAFLEEKDEDIKKQ
jgi:hypothetical protein